MCGWGADAVHGLRECAASAWLQAAGGEGSSEPAVEWTAARSSSRPARTCVRWVPVGGAGQGQAAGRRRHSVSRPANTPHRQQRGAGAVEGQSTAKPQLAAPKGGKGPWPANGPEHHIVAQIHVVHWTQAAINPVFMGRARGAGKGTPELFPKSEIPRSSKLGHI